MGVCICVQSDQKKRFFFWNKFFSRRKHGSSPLNDLHLHLDILFFLFIEREDTFIGETFEWTCHSCDILNLFSRKFWLKILLEKQNQTSGRIDFTHCCHQINVCWRTSYWRPLTYSRTVCSIQFWLLHHDEYRLD
jgi:hypothetical protein